MECSQGVGLVLVDGEYAGNRRGVVDAHLMALDAALLLQGALKVSLLCALA